MLQKYIFCLFFILGFAIFNCEAKAKALIIGISKYNDPTVKNLNYAHRGAINFRKTLTTQSIAMNPLRKKDTKLLTNSSATKKNIEYNLRTFFKKLSDKDKAIIYFGGHASSSEEDISLLTYNNYKNKKPLYMLDLIWKVIENSEVGTITLFLDTCKSGFVIEEHLFFDEFLKTDKTINILTSGESERNSYESTKLKSGLFTYYLIKGLQGEADINDDYIMTFDELIDYVHNKVVRIPIYKFKNVDSATKKLQLYRQKPQAYLETPYKPFIEICEYCYEEMLE